MFLQKEYYNFLNAVSTPATIFMYDLSKLKRCKSYAKLIRQLRPRLSSFLTELLKICLPRYRFHGIFNIAKQAFASEGS